MIVRKIKWGQYIINWKDVELLAVLCPINYILSPFNSEAAA